MPEIKIAEYKIRKYGKRGYETTIPRIWVDDLGLTIDDRLVVSRDEKDRLILEAREKEPVCAE